MTDHPRDMASQRVDHALHRFQEAWESRDNDVQTLSQELDELDVAVGIWVDQYETATRGAVTAANDEADTG